MTIYSLDILLSHFLTSLLFCIWFWCFLTCIQISQEAGKLVWCSHLLQNFLVSYDPRRGFSVVSEEVETFPEYSFFFYDPMGVGNLISGSSAFSKSSLNIWKFMVHILFKSGLETFKHYFTSVWDECSCGVVWAFLGMACFGDCNKNLRFPVLWPLLSFPNLLAYWVQHFNSIIF